jgi:hypothetical protein
MLISTALLLDSIIRNSVCTPAKLPCRRVEVGYKVLRNTEIRLTKEENQKKNTVLYYLKFPSHAILIANEYLMVIRR